VKNDNIIVLKKFETLIEANIAKTKLNAYGIPCFLTEENLTNMTTHLLSGGIRLHIFAQDEDRAKQIVVGDKLGKSEEDGILECPKCQSRKIISNRKDTTHAKMTQAIVGFLLGLSKPYYCQHCGNEFGN
jgi:DNA-directed RNA polymerase subunit RPC12/RpoP